MIQIRFYLRIKSRWKPFPSPLPLSALPFLVPIPNYLLAAGSWNCSQMEFHIGLKKHRILPSVPLGCDFVVMAEEVPSIFVRGRGEEAVMWILGWISDQTCWELLRQVYYFGISVNIYNSRRSNVAVLNLNGQINVFGIRNRSF